MCRTAVDPRAAPALAVLLTDLRDAPAHTTGVDPGDVHVGPVDLGPEEDTD